MGKIKNFWKDRNVFVTGATGFIGSWLVKTLVSKGANVTVLIRDHIPNSYFNILGLDRECNIVNGNLEDYNLLLRTFNEFEIESCFHLGAQTIVGYANRSPLSTFKSNIDGTFNILEAARNSHWVKRIVIASTDKAYGSQEDLPYKEDAPLLADHPYDVSKACADRIANTYFKTYGLPVAITRCGNIYGGGDLNLNRIIPGTIKSLYLKESPIIRSDGTFTRDYNYIQDIVDGYLLIAENMERKEVKGEAFNLSNNHPYSALEVVNTIIKLTKSKMKPTILNQASNEIKHQYLEATKANKILGWKPNFDLEKGLIETIYWYKNFFKLKKI